VLCRNAITISVGFDTRLSNRFAATRLKCGKSHLVSCSSGRTT